MWQEINGIKFVKRNKEKDDNNTIPTMYKLNDNR